MSSNVQLIRLRGVLALAAAGYLVVRQAGVVDPASGPLDPVVAAVGALPATVGLVVAAALGLLVGVTIWLCVLCIVRLPIALTRLHGSDGLSPVLTLSAIAGAILLASFLVAGAVLVGQTGSLWGGDGVTGAADEVDEDELPTLEDAENTTSPSLDDAEDTNGPSLEDSQFEGVPTLEDIDIGGDGISLSDPYSRCSAPDGADRDGDRLPDRWEENDETPDGAPLPGADPDRKDIYVQPLYEQGAERFTDEEKRQLRSVFDRMPVDNPGGEEGIALHFVDGAPDDGRVDDQITVGHNLQLVRDQYYTERTLGDGVCRYHLLIVGTVTGGDMGKAEVPGFVAVVDSSRRSSPEASVTPRVAITTHELLHNVVGRVGAGHHTSAGWLAPVVGPDDEYLNTEAQAELDDGFASP